MWKNKQFWIKKVKRVQLQLQINSEKTKECNGYVAAQLKTFRAVTVGMHKTDDNVIQTIIVWTYLSGKHKQSDEEDKEGDRAHSLQVFENSWSWRVEKKGNLCVEKDKDRK